MHDSNYKEIDNNTLNEQNNNALEDIKQNDDS
jgi:hypothetical protein